MNEPHSAEQTTTVGGGDTATLADEEIETRHLDASPQASGDDTSDTADESDTGDDSGDAADPTDTGDDSGDGSGDPSA